MTYDELIRRLRARNALIVHFSHHSKMRDGGVFPADLHAVIANSRAWPLSCCVVWPGHKMSLPGSVGVVLRPRSLASIVGVGKSDIGSTTMADGSQGSLGDKLDDESFAKTFDVAEGDYNEWRMIESDVVGVYVENSSPRAKRHVELCDPDDGTLMGLDISAEPVALHEVVKSFPELPVLTKTTDGIMALKFPANTIYPWPPVG
jgi:hypothetical protein